jgi:hypothetical protein
MPKTPTLPASTATPASGFEIIYTNVILSDLTRGTNAAQATLCDVARLADGRQVARSTSNGVLTYNTFPSDPRVAAEFIGSAENLSARFANQMEAVRVRSQLRALQMTTLQAEIHKFRLMFPAIADLQGLERERPSPCFSTGEVFVGISAPHGLLGVDGVWPIVDRHAAGDFGTHGHFSSTPLSPEEEFMIGLLPTVERRNSAAILSGSGIVRSEYVLEEKWQARYREQARIDVKHGNPPGAASIWTLLSGGVGRSLVRIIPAGSEK